MNKRIVDGVRDTIVVLLLLTATSCQTDTQQNAAKAPRSAKDGFCAGEENDVKATTSISVPESRRDEFVRFITDEANRDQMAWMLKQSDQGIKLTLQKSTFTTPPHFINMVFENSKAGEPFRLKLTTCNAHDDWKTIWEREEKYARSFMNVGDRAN